METNTAPRLVPTVTPGPLRDDTQEGEEDNGQPIAAPPGVQSEPLKATGQLAGNSAAEGTPVAGVPASRPTVSNSLLLNIVSDVAHPAAYIGAAVSTSSQGATMDKRSELDWWTDAVIGILGMGVILQ
jgi:hypothetical protein